MAPKGVEDLWSRPRLVWSPRIAAEFTPHDWEVGDPVMVNHPDIDGPAFGEITATIYQAPFVFVRFDGVEQVAMVPVIMLERP